MPWWHVLCVSPHDCATVYRTERGWIPPALRNAKASCPLIRGRRPPIGVTKVLARGIHRGTTTRLRAPAWGAASRFANGRTNGPSPPTAEGTSCRRCASTCRTVLRRDSTLHRQHHLRALRLSAQRSRAPLPHGVAAVVRRPADRVSRLPQGGARRGVQAGEVNRGRPRADDFTGACGLPFATMTRPRRGSPDRRGDDYRPTRG